MASVSPRTSVPDNSADKQGQDLIRNVTSAPVQQNIINTYVLDIDWSQIQISEGQVAVLEFQLDNSNSIPTPSPVTVQFHAVDATTSDTPVSSVIIPNTSSADNNGGLCINQYKRNVIPILPLGLVPKLQQSSPTSAISIPSLKKTEAPQPKLKTEDKITPDKKITKSRRTNYKRQGKLKLTSSGSLLTRNVSRRHPSSRQPVPCPQCSKVFSSAHSLKRHSVKHSDDPSPFKCEECGTKFTQAAALSVHRREIHSESKVRHPCAFCPKKFRRSRVLKAHILRVHSASDAKSSSSISKPRLRPSAEEHHECVTCSAKFRYRQDLRRHGSKHTGEKRHQCPHCSRTFRLAYNLREHIDSHSGRRAFQSKYCGRSFRRKQARQKHERRHEEEGHCKQQQHSPKLVCCRVPENNPYSMPISISMQSSHDFSIF